MDIPNNQGIAMVLPENAKYGVWLRAQTPSGGKDWVVFQTDKEILSFRGKVDQVSTIPNVLLTWPHRHFLDAQVKLKFGKGYREVLEWREGHGWCAKNGPVAVPISTQVAMLPPAPPPKPKPPPPPPKPVAPQSPPKPAKQLVKEWINEKPAGTEEWF